MSAFVVAALMTAPTTTGGPVTMAEQTLFSFDSETDPGRWMIVNDGVMGGLSTGRISITGDQTAVFEGETSLENNGGFASIRGLPAVAPAAESSRLAIRVRTDGREYQLRIRSGNEFDGVAYRWTFQPPADEWVTIEAPYRDFVPTFRGRILSDVPPIDPESIRQIGFMIADKRQGPFRIEIDSITALD